MPKVFISYEFKDKITKPIVENWRSQSLGEDISFISIPYIPDEPRLGRKALKRKIANEILKADIMVVLVSGNTHSKPWMLYEIRVAQSNGIKLFWCEVPDTKAGLPKELVNVAQIPLRLKDVEKAIRSYQSVIDSKN